MAEGKRPVPFRTRKLSPPAPMVLHPRGCGRVGHRRTQCEEGPGAVGRETSSFSRHPGPFFIAPTPPLPDPYPGIVSAPRLLIIQPDESDPLGPLGDWLAEAGA